MKFGLEREYFITRDGQFCLSPTTVPHDECGYLAEARGEPHTDPTAAIFSLLADEHRVRIAAKKCGCELVLEATAKLPTTLIRDALRSYGKPPATATSLYGRTYRDLTPRAGVHIHFSNEINVTHDGKLINTVAALLDIPKIIMSLDQAFADVIREARRLPGMYGMKPWGFEYRSLPTTVDLLRVAAFLDSVR